MMFSYKFVRLIEANARDLAAGLEIRVQTSSQLAHFHRLPQPELRERVYEIYRHLGEWLLGCHQLDIELRYRQIGARRAQQGIPLSEVVQVIVLTKDNLWDFLRTEAMANHAVEILGEIELLQMLQMFFDRAIYYAVEGYEEEIAGRANLAASRSAA